MSKLVLVFTLSIGVIFSGCKKENLFQFNEELVPNGNVILLTLDGVRYEEFFNKDLLPTFWAEHAEEGIVLGDPTKKSRVRIANPVVLSLPGYKTMHSGKRTNCFSNECKFGKIETLAESLIRTKNWAFKKVAVISSWFPICYAAMRKINNVFNSCGLNPLALAGHEEINTAQKEDPPIWHGRKDKYTFEHGMRFIQSERPRFLHLSLLDSDEWAHDKDWDNYIQSIRDYDVYIDKLYQLLNSLGEYGENTTVIITTDHGRGKGKRWNTHPFNWHARKIWMSIKGPGIPKSGSISHKREVNHLHLRPFIEMILNK